VSIDRRKTKRRALDRNIYGDFAKTFFHLAISIKVNFSKLRTPCTKNAPYFYFYFIMDREKTSSPPRSCFLKNLGEVGPI